MKKMRTNTYYRPYQETRAIAPARLHKRLNLLWRAIDHTLNFNIFGWRAIDRTPCYAFRSLKFVEIRKSVR